MNDLPQGGDERTIGAGTSVYAYRKGDVLVSRVGDVERPADAKTVFYHDLFMAMVESRPFVCQGAKTAFGRGTYRLAIYTVLGGATTTRQLHADLRVYVKERASMEPPFCSFVALFEQPYFADESTFEAALWKQLQSLHEIDSVEFGWDPTTSNDPASDQFSFSVVGTSFFVIGMHPASSRLARKFVIPAMVFNAHDQFEELRRTGVFNRTVTTNRARDLRLQGSINPNLAHFGQGSEAAQYSGRAVAGNWKCPFHPVTAREGSAGMSPPMEESQGGGSD